MDMKDTLLAAAGLLGGSGGGGGGGGGYVASDWLDPAKPIGDIHSDAATISVTVGGRTGITSVEMPNLTTAPEGFVSGCTGLVSCSFPSLSKPSKNMFSNCMSLLNVALPQATPGGSSDPYVFNNCRSLIGVDYGKTGTDGISNTHFQSCLKLNTLVLRSTSVVPLLGTGAFTSSPFASGKSGGTLYVPSSLVSEYTQATNWSTILGYANNQIKAIEGSIYETQYADGTPIS